MLLNELSPGIDARILYLRAPGDVLRLKEIGLRPGERVRVVQKAGLGGRLLALGCGRVALDAGTARRIEVEEIQ